MMKSNRFFVCAALLLLASAAMTGVPALAATARVTVDVGTKDIASTNTLAVGEKALVLVRNLGDSQPAALFVSLHDRRTGEILAGATNFVADVQTSVWTNWSWGETSSVPTVVSRTVTNAIGYLPLDTTNLCAKFAGLPITAERTFVLSVFDASNRWVLGQDDITVKNTAAYLNLTNGVPDSIFFPFEQAISDLASHIANTDNPHNVTAEQLGALTAESDPNWAAQSNEVMTAIGDLQGKTNAFTEAYNVGGMWVVEDKVDFEDDVALNGNVSVTLNINAVRDVKASSFTLDETSVTHWSDLTNGVNSALAGHVADTNNPHGVTLDQLGLLTKLNSLGIYPGGGVLDLGARFLFFEKGTNRFDFSSENDVEWAFHGPMTKNGVEVATTSDVLQAVAPLATTSSVAAVASNLSSHTSATNNPHNLTAEQIGAIPKWPKAYLFGTTGDFFDGYSSGIGRVGGNLVLNHTTGPVIIQSTNDWVRIRGSNTQIRATSPSSGLTLTNSADGDFTITWNGVTKHGWDDIGGGGGMDINAVLATYTNGMAPGLVLSKMSYPTYTTKGFNDLPGIYFLDYLPPIMVMQAGGSTDDGYLFLSANDAMFGCDLSAPSFSSSGDIKGTSFTLGTNSISDWNTLATDAELADHLARDDNPHGVTAAQVGALPLTGGTITGNLSITGSSLALTNSVDGDFTVTWNGVTKNGWDDIGAGQYLPATNSAGVYHVNEDVLFDSSLDSDGFEIDETDGLSSLFGYWDHLSFEEDSWRRYGDFGDFAMIDTNGTTWDFQTLVPPKWNGAGLATTNDVNATAAALDTATSSLADRIAHLEWMAREYNVVWGDWVLDYTKTNWIPTNWPAGHVTVELASIGTNVCIIGIPRNWTPPAGSRITFRQNRATGTVKIFVAGGQMDGSASTLAFGADASGTLEYWWAETGTGSGGVWCFSRPTEGTHYLRLRTADGANDNSYNQRDPNFAPVFENDRSLALSPSLSPSFTPLTPAEQLGSSDGVGIMPVSDGLDGGEWPEEGLTGEETTEEALE